MWEFAGHIDCFQYAEAPIEIKALEEPEDLGRQTADSQNMGGTDDFRLWFQNSQMCKILVISCLFLSLLLILPLNVTNSPEVLQAPLLHHYYIIITYYCILIINYCYEIIITYYYIIITSLIVIIPKLESQLQKQVIMS